VIIPAFNEESAIGKVLSMIPWWVDDVIVADNSSTDGTVAIARKHGARVVSESRRGYGSACLAGLHAVSGSDILVFLDGDYSDFPEQMHLLVDPIATGHADIVIGSRMLGGREAGALPLQAVFGSWIACLLIRLFWQVRFTDLGPFRAVRASALTSLGMKDPDYGWTIEMQIKAAQGRFRVLEVPVSFVSFRRIL
jgi:glycosyltransferase involved in cell wall biosynthesis